MFIKRIDRHRLAVIMVKPINAFFGSYKRERWIPFSFWHNHFIYGQGPDAISIALVLCAGLDIDHHAGNIQFIFFSRCLFFGHFIIFPPIVHQEKGSGLIPTLFSYAAIVGTGQTL